MNNRIKLALLLFLPVFTIQAQMGKPFPNIEVFDLNENAVSIPEDTKGKFTLVGVAFSEAAQEDLYSWSQPVFSEFMDENNMSSLVYDPNVKLILMFTGANQLAFKKAKDQITEGTDEKMKDRKIPYFFVLDKNGKVIYTAEGRYSQKALREVGNLIED